MTAPERRPEGDEQVPAISAANVSHSFDRRGKGGDVLRNIDLLVPKGEFVAIVGPSGCGKTTFLNLVAGLEQVQSGDLLVNGSPPKAGDRGVSYVFARNALLPWRTVGGNVSLPLELLGIPKVERKDRVRDALQRVGLVDYQGAYRSQLSQGMRQRVALARAMVTNPTLILMDEPFAALDAQTRIAMQEDLLGLLAHGAVTVLLITHDLDEAITLADRVVIFTQRPATIKASFEVGLPRPRSALELRANHEFHAIYEAIWLELRGEVKVL